MPLSRAAAGRLRDAARVWMEAAGNFSRDAHAQDIIEYALLLGFIGLALLGSGIHIHAFHETVRNARSSVS